MKTRILVITHRNFTKLVSDVMEELNLPVELTILEAGFGEVNQLIDLESISTYDMVIASGAHMAIIKRDFHELLYAVPIYPLRFSEADLVKSLVEAKGFGQKILLMYFSEEEYDLEKYCGILDIQLIRPQYQDLQEAQKLLLKYKKLGFHTIVGTSSICELAKKNGCHPILIYSSDSMKLELMKAYQLGTMRNKMMKYAKMKETLFHHSQTPIFMLNPFGVIADVNESGLLHINKRSKHEIIGENMDQFLNKPVFGQLDKSPAMTDPICHVDKKQHVVETTVPIYINSKLEGFITHLDKLDHFKEPALSNHPKSLHTKYKFKDIVVHSPTIKKVIVKAKQYAKSAAPILIYGESGTGKELLAHSIHQYSSRKEAPFLPVNCAAIPHNILESELFGYDEGTFTGAKKGGKPGFFEMAQGGTIFLDEIGEIPLETQTKLLRVLQEKEIIRLGGRKIIPLEVRIICATNKSLPELIGNGQFREDLYYRINVLQINVPSLKDREEDILSIFRHLLLKHGMAAEQADYLVNKGQKRILAYRWPGNIRELENCAQRITALTTLGTTTIDLIHFFDEVISEYKDSPNPSVQLNTHKTGQMSLKESERSRIIHCLMECNGNRVEAADRLSMSRTTLWRKMKELNIT